MCYGGFHGATAFRLGFVITRCMSSQMTCTISNPIFKHVNLVKIIDQSYPGKACPGALAGCLLWPLMSRTNIVLPGESALLE
jgi:hypothetical protein